MQKADDLYDKLIRPIESKMTGIVARIVRDPEEAEDVFQEVLAIIWEKLEYIDQLSNPHGYILRICITRSYDTLRKRIRRQRWEFRLNRIKNRFLYVQPLKPQRDLDLSVVVRDAIAMLPPRQGQAVLLRIIENMSYYSIGGILGCTEATARSHFSKGRTRLAKIMRELAVS